MKVITGCWLLFVSFLSLERMFSTVYGRSSPWLMCCRFFFLFIVFVFKFWLEKCQHWALCTRECLYHGCLNSLWLWASLLKTTVKRGPGISSEQANFSASFSNLLRVVSAAPTGHHWWKERFKALQLLFMSLALQHLDLDNKLCLRITISTGLWKLYAAETLSCY